MPKKSRRRRITKGKTHEAAARTQKHALRLVSLEKDLARSSRSHLKNASARPARPRDFSHAQVEWRLAMLEGVLNAEQRAHAQPTTSTVEPDSDGIKRNPRTRKGNAVQRHHAGTTGSSKKSPSPVGEGSLITYNTMADRLATEVIRRQGLEERIAELEAIIKDILEKRDNGAIDIISPDLETSQHEPALDGPPRKEMKRVDFTPQKVRSGTPRLDDLLLGGIPFGSNVLLYGPPFAGKELLMSAFIAEGVKWGTPVIWLLTDRSPREIREEMKLVFPEYEDAEKLGIIRYIDAHSRAVGSDTAEPFTDYVDSPTDFEAIQRFVESAAREFKKEHDYYRMAVRGLSTLIAYSDSRAVFRFLNSFVGKRKRDKAVTLYTIAKGVHTDHDIQMISSLMDGVIELKFENHETYMVIKGICDVRSRAYVRYSLSKAGMEIGSFSLDHIR